MISRKACALVAYLALAPGMRESRDRLAGLLWSETDSAKSRSSLRQTLHIVRKAFRKEGLTGALMDNLCLRLDGRAFATDLDDAVESIERGEPADFLMSEVRITDVLLHGYDDIDPSFGSWLRVKRESVRQRLMRGLEDRLSDRAISVKARKRVACALFQLDSTNEVACRELMHAFMDSGNAAGALAAYAQLWNCLEVDYDIEPSPATQELAVAIKRGIYPTYQRPLCAPADQEPLSYGSDFYARSPAPTRPLFLESPNAADVSPLCDPDFEVAMARAIDLSPENSSKSG